MITQICQEVCVSDFSDTPKVSNFSLSFFSSSSSKLWKIASILMHLINYHQWKTQKAFCIPHKNSAFISTNPALQVCKVFFATILILCKIDPILVTFPVSNQPSKAIDQTASQPVDTTHTSVKTVYLLIMNIVENTLKTCLPSTDFESQPLVSTFPNTYEETLNGKFAL